MKVRLYVNEEAFVIEECEGAPEIRREAAAKSTADTALTTYPFEDDRGAGPSIRIKVEAVH